MNISEGFCGLIRHGVQGFFLFHHIFCSAIIGGYIWILKAICGNFFCVISDLARTMAAMCAPL